MVKEPRLEISVTSIERMADDVEDIESELINYSGLVGKGVRPNEAVKMLASERQLKRDNPGLGNTGNSGFQNDDTSN